MWKKIAQNYDPIAQVKKHPVVQEAIKQGYDMNYKWSPSDYQAPGGKRGGVYFVDMKWDRGGNHYLDISHHGAFFCHEGRKVKFHTLSSDTGLLAKQKDTGVVKEALSTIHIYGPDYALTSGMNLAHRDNHKSTANHDHGEWGLPHWSYSSGAKEHLETQHPDIDVNTINPI